MTKEQKKELLEHFEKLDPLFEIIRNRSGQSWWSPPCEDWHFICDMGYVSEFLEQLESWLRDDDILESRLEKYKNTNLISPPSND